MAEEITTQNEERVETMESSYLEQINSLKQNTVSKEQYAKLLNENKNLLKTIVDGSAQTAPAPKEPVNIDALTEELATRQMSNLEYCQKALELRQAVLEQEGRDIFVGQGHDLVPTTEAYASAARVADVMRECIDESEGSSELFTANLMRRTNDIQIPKRR